MLNRKIAVKFLLDSRRNLNNKTVSLKKIPTQASAQYNTFCLARNLTDLLKTRKTKFIFECKHARLFRWVSGFCKLLTFFHTLRSKFRSSSFRQSNLAYLLPSFGIVTTVPVRMRSHLCLHECVKCMRAMHMVREFMMVTFYSMYARTFVHSFWCCRMWVCYFCLGWIEQPFSFII